MKAKIYHLLVLPPQKEPVYFIIESEDHGKEFDGWKYLYESHSCPTNWLKPVHMVHDGDHDPHGLILYIASKKESELPPDANYGPNDRDFAFDAWVESTNGMIPEPID